MARRRYQNGTVAKRGSSWELRWREDVVVDGKTVRRNRREKFATTSQYPTKRLALRDPFVLQKQLEINDPNLRPRVDVTFSAFVLRWEETVLPQYRKQSYRDELQLTVKRLEKFFGPIELKSITTETVQRYVAQRAVGAKTIDNEVSALRAVWRVVKGWGYASQDPFFGLKLPEIVKPEKRRFTADEVKTILANCQEPYRTIYWVLFETGLRSGEVCALRWEDVDLDARAITVKRRIYYGVLDEPKTSAGRRTFAIGRTLAAHLRTMKQAGSEWVFPNFRNEPKRQENILKDHLRPLLKRLGIWKKGFGLHAFRHGNATLLDQLNVSMAQRMSRLGHATPQQTMGYTSADWQQALEVADRVDEAVKTVMGVH